mmetsp:Transcript_20165/g.32587  ORF Transcript_20165/g.32587 Transcript_20165/m.32587 type:complete len:94 (+) Transcript_20165:510-791(+)
MRTCAENVAAKIILQESARIPKFNLGSRLQYLVFVKFAIAPYRLLWVMIFALTATKHLAVLATVKVSAVVMPPFKLNTAIIITKVGIGQQAGV